MTKINKLTNSALFIQKAVNQQYLTPCYIRNATMYLVSSPDPTLRAGGVWGRDYYVPRCRRAPQCILHAYMHTRGVQPKTWARPGKWERCLIQASAS